MIMPTPTREATHQSEIREELERLREEVKCPYDVEAFEGDNLTVELMTLLGPEKFRELQERFGGQRIWIPKAGGPTLCRFCPTRDEHIRDLRALGKSVAWIAQKFGLSEKRVYGILEQG